MAALGRMLSGAAHEINNPLAGVLGRLELLLRQDNLDPQLRNRLQPVWQDANRVVTLVRNLLKTSHRDDGRRVLLDLNQVIRDALALRQHDFAGHGIRVELALDPGEVRVLGSELGLQQAFLNIIANACDALSEVRWPGVLTIQSARGDGHAVVSFLDNGPGLRSPSQVFEPFYTTKEVGKGTGLGLTLSYGIAQDHGGQITAENRPQGGAAFTVVLPLAPAASTLPAVEEPGAAVVPSEPVAGRAKTSVLVVDDEPNVLDLELQILQSSGDDAVGVCSGAEAIAALRRGRFDLIVSDMKMPGGVSGPDLYRWVQEHQPHMADRIIFLTGDTLAENTQEFLRQSKRPCLEKPFAIDEYIAVVHEVLHAQSQAA